jgi:Zn-dependent protease with chaperone function
MLKHAHPTVTRPLMKHRMPNFERRTLNWGRSTVLAHWAFRVRRWLFDVFNSAFPNETSNAQQHRTLKSGNAKRDWYCFFAGNWGAFEGVGMNFFQQQEQARRRSRRLIFIFALLVLVVMVLVYFIVAPCILSFHEFRRERVGIGVSLVMMWFGIVQAFFEAIFQPHQFWKDFWRPQLFAEISIGTLLVVAAGSISKMMQLSRGGSVVAELLGGRLLDQRPTDLDELQLRHVVEEMAIASSMPMPAIYVLDDERGINSFAAGHTTSDVAIGVTRGCLRLLTRDELQGVVAHEFSHILNGDTRLNMRLMGLAHGMLFPSIVGRKLISQWTVESEQGASIFDKNLQAAVPFLMLGGLLQMTGWISLPFVRLLKSAICREREWLADASAVQFTRNPEGIAGALKKIGGLIVQGRLRTPHAETASHLYFTNSSSDALFQCLATHPPLDKRILAIFPYFDGQFPHVKMLPMSESERAQRLEESLAILMLSPTAQNVVISNGEKTISAIQAREIAAQFRNAGLVRQSIPDEVIQTVHQPASAMAFIYALLLDADDAARTVQLKDLQPNTAPEIFAQATALANQTASLDERAKLALIDMALPALRGLTFAQYEELMRNTEALIESDRAIVLFEYTMQKVLERHLSPHFHKTLAAGVDFRSLQPLTNDCAVLLSALARMDQNDPGIIQRAFTAGAAELDLRDAPISLVNANECNLPQIAAALERAARGSLYVRRNLMYACAHTAAAIGRLPGREILLLRAIADALDCPVPPCVDAAEAA